MLCATNQVDAGGGAPQRVLSVLARAATTTCGQSPRRPAAGQRTAWFTRHYLVASSSNVARRSIIELVKGMRILEFCGGVWIPLVVLVVIACAGFVVSRVHGIFGTETRPSYTDGQVNDTKPFNPKQVVYEVFGPTGTVADISYFDVNSKPQQVDGARLPWSLTITTTSPAVVASLVAQGDSDSIGCRIVVDGEVKAERISNAVNAFTHCLAKGA